MNEKLCIARWNDIRYQGDDGCCPDLENPAYWIDGLREFDETYDDVILWNRKLKCLEISVYNTIYGLWDLGRYGWQVLIDEELYINIREKKYRELPIHYRGDDGYDTRYRADFEDAAYWDSKLRDLKDKYERAKHKSLSPRIFTPEELE
ncbi:hypothetical protein DV735_g1157, partial [Chaetothyriales sp. CBS 134920]